MFNILQWDLYMVGLYIFICFSETCILWVYVCLYVAVGHVYCGFMYVYMLQWDMYIVGLCMTIWARDLIYVCLICCSGACIWWVYTCLYVAVGPVYGGFMYDYLGKEWPFLTLAGVALLDGRKIFFLQYYS